MERIRTYIYNLIGFKDYTRREILEKVRNKFSEEKIIEFELKEILDYLEKNKYIDDETYLKNYTQNQYNKGYGWNRIKQELKYNKKIPEDLIKDFELNNNYDWFELAKEVKLRKYPKVTTDYKEESKQKQYLIRRGFSFEEISYAFEKDY